VSELTVAAFCGIWAAVALAPEGWTVVLAPAFALVVLLSRRRPGLAGFAFAVVSILAAVLGVPADSPAALPAGFAILFAAGRYADRRVGLAVLAANVGAVTAVDEFSVENLLFGTFLLGAVYVFGVLVRRRTVGARMAADDLSTLVALDPASLAAAAVAEERTRLAGEALAVVRRAVDQMCRQANRAESDLDTSALEAVQAGGREAVTELRVLLGLLRTDEPVEDAPPARPRRWPGVVVTVVALAGMFLLEDAATLDDVAWQGVALSIAVMAGAAIGRMDVVLGCLVASAAVLVSVSADVPLVYGAWDTAACALLVWTAATDGRVRAYVAAGCLATLTVLDVHRHVPGNEAFLVAVFAVSATAGHLWAERERAERAAIETAAGLRSQQSAIAAAAVRAERLRLARDLHDVVSHAIGVMVLQAGAAQALRLTDPAAAREAVRSVQNAGIAATSELVVLFGLVDSGALGAAGVAEPEEADLDALADRMRAGGLTVDLDSAGPPEDPAVRATAYRVVQEALTNAARHAPGAAVSIVVRPERGWLRVEVRNSGAVGVDTATPEPPARPTNGSGFGLVGLAERVRALGGDLAAGPADDGGFVVSARVPLVAAAVSP
jgi:signal transduction histidine kinase